MRGKATRTAALLVGLAVVLVMALVIASSSRTPPGLTITAVDGRIPVVRGSYCWRGLFSGGCADHSGPEELVAPILPTHVTAGTPIVLRFGKRPDDVSVDRLGKDGGEQIPLTDRQSFLVPGEPGIYAYRVSASWQRRGSVTYAFIIEIDSME